MPQLGSGNGSGYPNTIDTRQTFINSPVAAPDSASRLDAELSNDSLHAIVQVETTLGAGVQGNFGSLAARLQQFMPGGGSSPLFFGFTSTTGLSIPGTSHNLATAAPLIQVYDAGTPQAAIEPATVTVDQLSYDVGLTFATPQSGVVSLAAPTPQYTTSFTNQTSVTILGTTHGLGTTDLLVRVYTAAGTTNTLTQASVTIAPGTFNVVVTFATPQSGQLVLSNAGPRYAVDFTSQTTVTVLGAAHALDTTALLFQVYDAGSPRAVIRPNTFTVNQATFDVTLTFVTPQSGRLVLVQATAISGNDFTIQDSGVTNSTAVRVFSDEGSLQLQMGSGETVDVLSKTGGVVQSTSNAGDLAIAGTATKPGGGPWLSPSDVRLKHKLAPFTDGTAVVLALNPQWFEYNGQGGLLPDRHRHSGFIAQEVEPVAPYLIRHTQGKLHYRDAEPTDLLAFDAEAMLPLLVNTIKELVERIAALEARLAAPPDTETVP